LECVLIENKELKRAFGLNKEEKEAEKRNSMTRASYFGMFNKRLNFKAESM
jgi:hypothetical protein